LLLNFCDKEENNKFICKRKPFEDFWHKSFLRKDDIWITKNAYFSSIFYKYVIVWSFWEENTLMERERLWNLANLNMKRKSRKGFLVQIYNDFGNQFIGSCKLQLTAN